jgi:2-polyprenyl-3-methyl-5-hydroxy-6-metoxy-1,4-benzoquinol methylase
MIAARPALEVRRRGVAGSPGPTMLPRCPVCSATASRRLYRLPRFSIFACAACAQVYLSPVPSEEEIREMFRQLYTTGEGSVPELRSYYGFCYDEAPSNPLVQLYERWLDALERFHPPGTLLDIGCGTGLFLTVARRRGWTPFGIDDCAEATQHARERFGLDVQTGDFSAFAADGRRFDAITMWDIIEHAREPVGLLAGVRRCVAPGGVVALSTPNQRSILDVVAGTLYRVTAGRVTAPLEKFYIDQHFVYFTSTTLGQALARAGLDLVHVERELTDLRRLSLGPAARLVVQGLFQVARWTALENRLFAVARCH